MSLYVAPHVWCLHSPTRGRDHQFTNFKVFIEPVLKLCGPWRCLLIPHVLQFHPLHLILLHILCVGNDFLGLSLHINLKTHGSFVWPHTASFGGLLLITSKNKWHNYALTVNILASNWNQSLVSTWKIQQKSVSTSFFNETNLTKPSGR